MDATSGAALPGTVYVSGTATSLNLQVGGSGWTSDQLSSLVSNTSNWTGTPTLGIDTTNAAGGFTYTSGENPIAGPLSLTQYAGTNALTLGVANTYFGLDHD